MKKCSTANYHCSDVVVNFEAGVFSAKYSLFLIGDKTLLQSTPCQSPGWPQLIHS